MATNTTKIGDNSGNDPVAKFKAAGLAEIDNRSKADMKASNALMFAVLATDSPVILSDWRNVIADFHNGDEKLRDKARTDFAKYIGAEAFLETSGDGPARKTQDYRNLVLRQYQRIQFAVDVHTLGYREAIIIHDNTKNMTAYVKGNSTLATAIWAAKKWQDNKTVSGKRNPMMDILIAQRASATQQGEVSWAGLAEMVAKWSNRTGNTVRKAVTVSAKAPIAALKAVSGIISNTDMPVHFSSVESRMQALETSEDIMAFAVEGDDPAITDLRTKYNAVIEEVREYLQHRINAKAQLLTKAAA